MLQGMKYGPAASHGVEVHNTQPYEVSKTHKGKIVILSATFSQHYSMSDCYAFFTWSKNGMVATNLFLLRSRRMG